MDRELVQPDPQSAGPGAHEAVRTPFEPPLVTELGSLAELTAQGVPCFSPGCALLDDGIGQAGTEWLA